MTMDALTWLQQVRKLDGALLSHMGVVEKQHPQIGRVAAFQYVKSGKPYAAKFRGIDAKEWRSSQGVSRDLYNFDALTTETALPIVLTEGEMDCLSVIQAGYSRAVSLPDGWTADGGKRDVIIAAEALFRQSPYVIVAGDNDEAGASLPRTIANVLRGHDVRFVAWPDGCKDANDVLVQHGEGVLNNCLLSARRMDPEGGFITGISDLPPLPARRVLRANVNPLDFVLAFEIGAMSIGTGTPGSGKSTLTTFAAYHVAMSERVRVGFLAFETHPYKIRDHLCRLATGKPWAELPDMQQQVTGAKLDLSFRIVHRTYDAGSHNLGWLKEMVYTLAVRDNCKLVIVDPWNELEHLPEPGESMTAYINFAIQQIRVWAEQYDCHICLIAHPRKMATEGKARSPTGYDIADSAAFFNKPSLGFTVHQEQNDQGENFVKLSCWKVRDTQLYGIERGDVLLTFDTRAMDYRRFESAAA